MHLRSHCRVNWNVGLRIPSWCLRRQFEASRGCESELASCAALPRPTARIPILCTTCTDCPHGPLPLGKTNIFSFLDSKPNHSLCHCCHTQHNVQMFFLWRKSMLKVNACRKGVYEDVFVAHSPQKNLRSMWIQVYAFALVLASHQGDYRCKYPSKLSPTPFNYSHPVLK